jgi:hypothetical protein
LHVRKKMRTLRKLKNCNSMNTNFIRQSTPISNAFLLFVITIILAGCISQFPTGKYPDDNRDRDDEKTFPFSALNIPRGHLPPPGECKIWIPGRPPGQQGPPQSCLSALREAPLGSWVITHETNRFKVNIFNKSRRNVIDEIRYYAEK